MPEEQPIISGGKSPHPLGHPRIQLLYLPGCPLVERVRATLRESLSSTGSHATVEEIEGPCASPTLLVDGVDVAGRTPPPSASCRLDLPSKEQIVQALLGPMHSPATGSH